MRELPINAPRLTSGPWRRWLPFAAFLALMAYESLGVFPISPVEGDGIGIANGAAQAAWAGLGPTPLSYRYSVQSGTYALIVMVHKLTGLDTLVAFSLLSAACAVLFTFVSAKLLTRIVGFAFPLCGVVVLLFQEVLTGGYYANSTVLAAAFSILALYVLATRERVHTQIVAGILLGVGAWMRFDAILVAPVSLLLLHRGDWRQTFGRNAIVAVTAIVVCTSAIYLSGGSIGAILPSTSKYLTTEHSGTPDLAVPLLGAVTVKSHMSYFSVCLLFLIILGILYLLRTRDWYVLGLLVLGVVPFYVLLRGKITSPKYIYYLAPFFCLPVLSAVRGVGLATRRRRALCLSAVIVLLISQYVGGLRLSFASKPYIAEPYPTFAYLFAIDPPVDAITQASVVVGSGTLITSPDGPRLSSGILYAPLMWHHQKSTLNAELTRFRFYLASRDDNPLFILAPLYQARQLVLHVLLDGGHDCTTTHVKENWLGDYRYVTCTEGHRSVIVLHQQYSQRSFEMIRAGLSLIDSPKAVFVTRTDWELDLFLRHATNWRRICGFAYEMEIHS